CGLAFPFGGCIAVVAWMERPFGGGGRKFGEPLQILCDCCQRELELRTARSSQAQSSEPQNALEVREQHLDLFTIAARPRERFSLGESAGDIARSLIHIADDSSCRQCLGSTLA